MTTVSIVNECVTEYRVPVWNGLRALLASHGVRLRVLHGRAHSSFAHRGDTVKLDWSEEVPMREFRLAGKELVYLELGDTMRVSDLVITTQEVRLLHNFRLLWQQMLGQGRLALMGHGRDQLKRGRTSISENLKIWMSRRVHWWFAYNNYTAREVEGFGYPSERITTFMNSTDTHRLRAFQGQTTSGDLDALRKEIGLGAGPVAIYVGAIDRVKQVGYLIQAARRVRELLPGFELLIVGAGPEREPHRIATEGDSWIHWIPSQFGESKVRHMMLAELYLLPAWVGLGIVDSFALGIPLVTTDRFRHSVEIEYLDHGVNGWMCKGSPDAGEFGEEVALLLQDPALLRSLREGALRAGEGFSVEAMVANLAGGILKAIAAPSRT
jgi:glycosyltransferase involved in cell wall biosynthesis